MSVIIDENLRATFVAVADVLIPAHGEMPAASSVDVGDASLDRILTLRDDLKEAFFRGLNAMVGKNPVVAARALNAEDPTALATIGLVASAAYYMDARVRQLIGYPGQERRIIDPAAPPDYADLLQPVIDRGPFYRPTPE